MNLRSPPKFARWLLNRFGQGYRSNSLAGDLIEQYRKGRGNLWYWRQVVNAVVVAQVRHLQNKAFSLLTKAFGLYVLVDAFISLGIAIIVFGVTLVCAVITLIHAHQNSSHDFAIIIALVTINLLLAVYTYRIAKRILHSIITKTSKV